MVSCYVINIKKLATALDIGNGVNATQDQKAGVVHGLLYFVQNQALQGYADIQGAVECATAISNQSGENATHCQLPATAVHGSVYLLPNQELQGYTDTKGAVLCATAMSAQLGENATHLQVPATAVHGSLYLVQNQLLRG
jgi:hypothetical protein